MSTFQLPDLVAGLWRLDSWGLDARACADWAAACIDAGLDAFDLADIYGDHSCEERFGAALRARPDLRDRMQVITKCGIRFPSKQRPEVRCHHYDSSADHITRSVERSLVNLGTDRIDLLFIHRPDFLMDVDEVAGAFERLRAAGKVLHFGASNFTSAQLELLASRVALVTHQVEASVLCLDAFEDGTFDLCQRNGMRPMAWSPLAGGGLFRSDDARAVRVREALAEVGATYGGASIDTIAYAFLLRHPSGPRPITGTRDLERIRAARRALEIELTREEWYAIWTASKGTSLP